MGMVVTIFRVNVKAMFLQNNKKTHSWSFICCWDHQREQMIRKYRFVKVIHTAFRCSSISLSGIHEETGAELKYLSNWLSSNFIKIEKIAENVWRARDALFKSHTLSLNDAIWLAQSCKMFTIQHFIANHYKPSFLPNINYVEEWSRSQE